MGVCFLVDDAGEDHLQREIADRVDDGWHDDAGGQVGGWEDADGGFLEAWWDCALDFERVY